MNPAQRLLLRMLLWLAGVVIATVLVMSIIMEINVEKNGGGEMVDGIALVLGLKLIACYTVVLMLGRLLPGRGGARWGWHLLALMMILVFVPMILVCKVISGSMKPIDRSNDFKCALRKGDCRILFPNPLTMNIRSIVIVGLLIGGLFKVLHWPGANVIIVAAGLVAVASLLIGLRKPTRPVQ